MNNPKLTMTEVFDLLVKEREYQERVWPQATSEKKTPGDFAIYMQNYLLAGMNELSHKPGYDGLQNFIRKVTALGVASMQQFGAPGRSQAEIDAAQDRHVTRA